MASPIDLPLTITSELIKNCLDNDVILSKNTKIAFSRIGGVFILYISHLANEIRKNKGRSKITVTDIKEALEKAGFEDFNPKIEKSLADYESQLKTIQESNQNNSGHKLKDIKDSTTKINNLEFKES
jgi:DNA polymerase epsilon subunit 3